MKVKDLFSKELQKPEKFRSHSENDLISSINKVIAGSNFNTLGFELKSSNSDLANGNLKFKYKGNNYKITHSGKIYKGSFLLDEFEKNDDIHTHYSKALHMLVKRFKEEDK